MKKFLSVFFMLAFISAALVSCSKKGAETVKEAGPKSPVLAKVGAVEITQSDFDREIKTLPDYAQQMFEGKAGREKFLEELVKKEVLYQEAVKKGIEKNPDFMKKMEEFKKLTMVQELLEKEIMSRAKVSDQDVKDYYEKNKADFATTSQIKASHILVKTEEEAVKVLDRLKKGEKFEAIAKKESLDKQSAKNGGDIGYFSKGQVVPEFEKAAAGMKVGEVSSAPVKTSYGYHIIKVTDRKTGPVIEFDRVKEIIAQRLSGEKQKEAFDSYVSELKKGQKIEIFKDALSKLPEAKEKTQAPAAPEKAVEPRDDAKGGGETKSIEEAKPRDGAKAGNETRTPEGAAQKKK